MGQKKLIRFEEITTFPNVLIYPEDMPGRWAAHFGHAYPLTLELACGKGDYTLGLARCRPQENFIGVDVKGNRIWKGAKTALDEGLSNVAFLRTQIDHLDRYFAAGEVADIWITFPDPFLRQSRAKKRLTHPRFLHLYHRVLAPGGRIRLKTDSPELFAFTLEVIRETGCILHRRVEDVYAAPPEPLLRLQTFYEQMHLRAGRTIRYLEFSLPAVLPPLPPKKKAHGEAVG